VLYGVQVKAGCGLLSHVYIVFQVYYLFQVYFERARGRVYLGACQCKAFVGKVED
jgi:hypothetical protein